MVFCRTYLYFAVPGGVKYPTSSVRLGFFGNLFLFPKGNLLQFKFREAGVSHAARAPASLGLALRAQVSMYPDGHEIVQGPSCTLWNHTCPFSDNSMHFHMSHGLFWSVLGRSNHCIGHHVRKQARQAVLRPVLGRYNVYLSSPKKITSCLAGVQPQWRRRGHKRSSFGCARDLARSILTGRLFWKHIWNPWCISKPNQKKIGPAWQGFAQDQENGYVI